jgi:glycosyltransferase involved in cell wall biosynthesis
VKIGYLMEAGVPDVRSPEPSGPALHVLHTIRELRSLGHQVRLVAKLGGSIWASDDLSEYRPVETRWLDHGPWRMAERVLRRIQRQLRLPYLAWFDGLRFAGACRQELAGFDILYERMGWMGRGGSLAAGRLGVPHVLEVNGDHVREHELLGLASRPWQTRISRHLMRKVAQAATHTVMTGEGWRRRHISEQQVDPARTSVIHNGSEVVERLSRSELRCYRSQPPDRREPLRLIYAGSFDPWQSLPLLLRAVSRVVACGVNVTVTLAGSGNTREPLERMTGDLHIDHRVTFTGHLPMPELARQLARADAGVSLYDGREEFDGLKLLDYKCAGLATIATGRNGEPAVLRHGATGVIIAPGNEGALVEAIRDLEQDRASVVRMGRQARLEAEQRHRWRHTAVALERLLRDLVSARETETRAAA